MTGWPFEGSLKVTFLNFWVADINGGKTINTAFSEIKKTLKIFA